MVRVAAEVAKVSVSARGEGDRKECVG